MPKGTKVYIEGYGFAKINDVGPKAKGRKLEVLFPTHEEALQWGKRYFIQVDHGIFLRIGNRRNKK